MACFIPTVVAGIVVVFVDLGKRDVLNDSRYFLNYYPNSESSPSGINLAQLVLTSW